MKIALTAFAAVLAMNTILPAAGADAPGGKQKTNETKKAAPQQPAQGMVVAKDPDGSLRAPTAAEASALHAQPAPQARSGVSSVQSTAASGVMVVLDPATSNVYSVMTKGPDGKLRMECVNGEKEAQSLMRRGVTTAPASGGTVSEK